MIIIKTLLINAVECEPYITADICNVENHLEDFCKSYNCQHKICNSCIKKHFSIENALSKKRCSICGKEFSPHISDLKLFNSFKLTVQK